MTRKKEAGQALIAAVAALGIVLMGFAGLGIDVGYFRYEKRLQQTAADSAAIAGAAEIPFGAAGDAATAAQHDAAANGFAATPTLGQCPPPAPAATPGTVALTVNSPPCSGPHSGASGYVEVYVAQAQPTFFMRVLGVNMETVTARAVANGNANGGGCIYVLGTSPTAINMNGGATLNANGCSVTDDGGLTINNNATINASSTGVAGAYNNTQGHVNPAPITGIAPASDPLAHLPAPTAAMPCMMDPGIGNGHTVALPQGTYCGLTIGGGATVTLNGLYIITGSINIGNNATLTGTNITFYETAGTFALQGGANFTLAAPTTGSLAGILFWQAKSDTNAATIDNGANSDLTGAFYFPGATLNLQGGVSVAPYSIIVAQQLNIGNNATLTTNGNYSSLSGGSPIKDALLVE